MNIKIKDVLFFLIVFTLILGLSSVNAVNDDSQNNLSDTLKDVDNVKVSEKNIENNKNMNDMNENNKNELMS